MYNMTIPGRGFVPIMQWANQTVDGYLGLGYLVLIFVVVFTISKNYENKRAALGAMFLCMTMAVLFKYMSIVTNAIMFGSFAVFILAFMWLYLQD